MIRSIRWKVLLPCSAAVLACLLGLLLRSPQAPRDPLEQPPSPSPAELQKPGDTAQPSPQSREGSHAGPLPRPTMEPARAGNPPITPSTEPIHTETMTEEQLLEAIGGTNRTFKVAAALAAARNPTSKLVSAVMQAISVTADSNLRRTLIAALASIKPDAFCVPELVSHLGSKKDKDMQEAAQTALLRSGSPEVVQALIAHAEDAAADDYQCRFTGRALAAIRNSESVPELAKGLSSTNQAIVAGSSLALAYIGSPEGIQALFSHLELATGEDFRGQILLDAIAQVRSPNALPALTSMLTTQITTSSPYARRSALNALRNFGADQRTSILNQYLALESDPQLQAEARRLLNN